jgi:hypothetical protein
MSRLFRQTHPESKAEPKDVWEISSPSLPSLPYHREKREPLEVIASLSWLAFPVFLIVCFALLVATILFGVFAVKHPDRIPQIATWFVQGIQTVIIWGGMLIFGFFLIKLGKEFASLLKDCAHVAQAWIHALGERKRNNILALNSTHIAWNGDANIQVSSMVHETRQIQEHYDEEGEAEQAADVPDVFPLAAYLPLLAQLAQENIRLPIEEKKWLLGIKDGKPDIGLLYDLRSCAFGGTQGQGKSSSMVFHVFQALLNGFVVPVVDPHKRLQQSLSTRLEAVRSGLYQAKTASEEEEMIAYLQWVDQQLEERLSSGKDVPIIFLVVDELNSLFRRLKSDEHKALLQKILVNIAAEGRKAGIFLIASGQTWSSNTIGGADIRQNFPTRFSHRMEKRQMLLLLDCLQSELDTLANPALKPGEGVFFSGNGELYRMIIPKPEQTDGAQVLRIRNRIVSAVSNRGKPLPKATTNITTFSTTKRAAPTAAATTSLWDLDLETSTLSSGENEGVEPGVVDSAPGRNPERIITSHELETVLLETANGTSNKDIMKKLWNTPSGGADFRKDSEHLQRIRAHIARNHLTLLSSENKNTQIS